MSNPDVIAKLKALTEHMDRAGGDAYGMPECPWCKAQGSSEGDDNYHKGDCELVAARDALALLTAARPETEQETDPRVVDSQYAAPLATASENQPVPTKDRA